MMAQKMFKHGLIAHPLYDVWSQMKSRCENPNNKNYPGWGGRGIRVYSEWHEFKPFFEWAISNGYESGLTIDRRDNDGDYEPSNCRFVTTLVQNNNRRPRRWKKRPAFFTEPTYASN